VLLFPIGQGHIGPDARRFQGRDVLEGPIFGVAGHLSGMEPPPEACAKDEIKHRLVLDDLPWRHQHPHNDAALAAIDDVVYLVAQVGASTFEAHRRRIGVGGTDT
jgi:hypothetical protein